MLHDKIQWPTVAAFALALAAVVALYALREPAAATLAAGIGMAVLAQMRRAVRRETDGERAVKAYESYAMAVRKYDGREVPKWDYLSPRLREAWISAARVLTFVAALSFAAHATGCTQASDPSRELARGTIETLVHALKESDHACATFATARSVPTLAEQCARAYAEAYPSLVSAAEGVDAWNDGSKGRVLCATVHAAHALRDLYTVLEGAGARVPPVLEDALRLAESMTEAASRAGCPS